MRMMTRDLTKHERHQIATAGGLTRPCEARPEMITPGARERHAQY